MSIQDIWKKINSGRQWSQWFWVASIYGMAFVAIGAIGLSFQAKSKGEVQISTFATPAFAEKSRKQAPVGADTVYASKNGRKYYYADCSGLKRIKEENMVSFAAAALAESAGYSKAANCH